ncbi:phosphoribosyltransferase family protein [Eisenibacter elegans]|jgi:pyrimidine operon attenuation protein/uracil phosphoribosyltransferase|uniref:phosphoribosyltransferase family protein n=1 Tax=Eisenibacter elegans TaxID=997 RepID=UPI000404A7E9|nr:phosphoribosyltransferase family protein [Eisenibacter elegans]
MSTQEKILILNHTQVGQKITRMAYQIYENNFKEEHIVLAGISGGGYILAQRLQKALGLISPITIQLIEVSLDKKSPNPSNIQVSQAVQSFHGQTVILVDDVLNTGRTMAYCMCPFLEAGVKKLQTAVVVDRSHAQFPVSATYVGYAFATTLQDYIEVSFDTPEGVYMS